MNINWKLLGTPEQEIRTARSMALKSAELILVDVPNSINPYYEYGCILENLMVIEELGITDEKVSEYKYMTFGTPVSAIDMKYVIDKIKEAKDLVAKDHEVKDE